MESYYNTDSENEYQNDTKHLPDKKNLVIIAIIILIILIATFLYFSSNPFGPKFNLTNKDGNPIGFTGTISIDGKIVDSFGQIGEPIKLNSNGIDNFNVVIGTSGIDGIKIGNVKIANISGGQIKITNKQGQTITLSEDAFFIDENGNIVVTIDPNFDVGIDPSLIDFLSGDSLDFELQIILNDEITGEEYNIVIPVQIFFSEFIGTGCILLSREYVAGTTTYGQMEIETKVRISCNSEQDLLSFVTWKDNPKGSVEVHFERTYPTTLISYPLAVKSSPVPGDYLARIIYTPHIKEKGQKADFKVNFAIENSIKEVTFSVVNENLEQCVQVTTIDDTINNFEDTASIRIDTTKCSNPIEISICDNDYGCSGGVEGEILPSASTFILDKAQRNISFRRGEIPGVYGVTVHARVFGLNTINKAFVAEKEIFVKSVDETIYPEQFVVSLLGKGSRDSVKITNNQLTKDVLVDTSICNLYESSFGVDAGGLPLFGQFVNEAEWLMYLSNNPESYAGSGFYQSALINSMQKISSARSSAYSIATGENAKIKTAYLEVFKTDDLLKKIKPSIDLSKDAADNLRAELENQVASNDSKLTGQISGLLASLTALLGTETANCAALESSSVAVNSFMMTPGVPGWYPTMTGVSTATTSAATTKCSVGLADLGSAVLLINNIYNIYNQIDALSKDNSSINAKNAFENIKGASEKLDDAAVYTENALDYVSLALAYAASNDFEMSASDYLEAKNYLELALIENEKSRKIIEEIRNLVVDADDELTILSDGGYSTTDLTIQLISSVITLLDLLAVIQGTNTVVMGSLDTAAASCATAETALAGYVSACSSVVGGSACTAASAGAAIPGLCAGIATNIASNKTTAAQISQVLSITGLVLSSLEMYDQFNLDYVDDLTTAKTGFGEIVNDIDASFVLVANASISLQAAILASQNISNLQKEFSSSSTYLQNLGLEQEFHNYNRERLVGLVSTLIQTGFFNGAYNGGVYTTSDTQPILFSNNLNNVENKISFDGTLKENCENRVELMLPTYKTNLLRDAKEVQINGANVLSQWIFKNAKVNGVYESQNVDLLFVNDNLQKNSYATVTIKFDEHNYAEVVKPNAKFAPFNLPNNEVKEKEYKFHMKFNATPRNGATPKYSAVCENSLMLGATGSEALPKIILGWNWDDITNESVKDNYLDATQLSILVSKNLSKIDNFLSNSQIECPNNPVNDIVNRIVPPVFSLEDTSQSCFVPLSTIEIDEKPALYYYLDQSSSIIYNEYLFEEEKISNADELLQVLDFNVNLIRDGYGLEFQSDFVDYFTRRILDASPSFLDADKGMSKYFRNNSNFYFTSSEIDLLSKNDFSLNDTGLYNVKFLIDFRELPLINAGQVTSKIKVVLNLIKPINKDYSPFYYMPFNGGVGMSINNDRRFYGTSLLTDDKFNLINSQNISIGANQRDSLVKINYTEQRDIFELNSIKSNRSKLLTVDNKNNNLSVISSFTTATPLLFELNGSLGQSANFEYSILSGRNKLNGKTHNMFLLNSIDSCNDFYGVPMNYIRDTPDFLSSGNYSFGYDEVLVPGKIFASTIAYAPQNSDFSISYSQSKEKGKITSVNEVKDEIVTLTGINGMPFNNNSNNNTINSLSTLFEAVRAGSVCVTSLGNKEIYSWPENYLYEVSSVDSTTTTATSLQKEINLARLICIK